MQYILHKQYALNTQHNIKDSTNMIALLINRLKSFRRLCIRYNNIEEGRSHIKMNTKKFQS